MINVCRSIDFVSHQDIADYNHDVIYRHTYQNSSHTMPGMWNVPRMWGCWNSHILLVGLRKYSLSRDRAPTQMELSHGHGKDVYSRAILASSCWKHPSVLCSIMAYSDIDITQQMWMNCLQVHTTLWMDRSNMLSEISQTQEYTCMLPFL